MGIKKARALTSPRRVSTLARMQESREENSTVIRRLRSGVRGSLAALTGVFLLLFLVSSLFGGFQMATPLGILSCRHPGRLLLWTFAGALACTAAGHRREGPVDEIPLFGRAGAAGLVLTATILLWVRFLYRSYEPAFGHRPVPTVPFLSTHLLFLFSGLAALGAWHRLRRSEDERAAAFAALFLAVSPLWFHVSTPVVAAYAVLAAAWWAAPALNQLTKWVFASALVPVATVALKHWGWAGKRLQDQFVSCAAPGYTGWIVLAGLAGWWFTRSTRRPWLRAALLTFSWGAVLGGARGEAGFLGAVLLLPLLAGLMAAGIHAILKAAGRDPLPRNVILACLFGILLGLLRDGLDLGIRSPYAPPLAEPAAVQPAAEEAPE